MEIFQQIISWMVVGVGFVGWLIFLPQIKLLFKNKEAQSISLGLIWGSLGMQATILTHTILKKDWPLVFAITMNYICLIVVLILIYYYRKYPGGRKRGL